MSKSSLKKEYHKKYSKKYYKAHKAHLDKLSKEWINAHKHTKAFKRRVALANKKAYNIRYATIYKFKKKKCKDCKHKFPPCCMDFHHVRGRKLFEVGDKIGSYSLKKLFKEIKKCDVICANCHRIRTWVK